MGWYVFCEMSRERLLLKFGQSIYIFTITSHGTPYGKKTNNEKNKSIQFRAIDV